MQELTVHRNRAVSRIYAIIVGILLLLTLYDYFFRTGARGTTYLLLVSALIVLIALQWWTRHQLTISEQGLRLGRGALISWTAIEKVEITRQQLESSGWLELKVKQYDQQRPQTLILAQQRINTDLVEVVRHLDGWCQSRGKRLVLANENTQAS